MHFPLKFHDILLILMITASALFYVSCNEESDQEPPNDGDEDLGSEQQTDNDGDPDLEIESYNPCLTSLDSEEIACVVSVDSLGPRPFILGPDFEGRYFFSSSGRLIGLTEYPHDSYDDPTDDPSLCAWTRYFYDTDDRLSRAEFRFLRINKSDFSLKPAWEVFTQYEYDEMENPIIERVNGEIAREWTYYQNGWLKELKLSKDALTFLPYNQEGLMLSGTYLYTYDEQNRLIRAESPGYGNPFSSWIYRYEGDFVYADRENPYPLGQSPALEGRYRIGTSGLAEMFQSFDEDEDVWVDVYQYTYDAGNWLLSAKVLSSPDLCETYDWGYTDWKWTRDAYGNPLSQTKCRVCYSPEDPQGGCWELTMTYDGDCTRSLDFHPRPLPIPQANGLEGLFVETKIWNQADIDTCQGTGDLECY